MGTGEVTTTLYEKILLKLEELKRGNQTIYLSPGMDVNFDFLAHLLSRNGMVINDVRRSGNRYFNIVPLQDREDSFRDRSRNPSFSGCRPTNRHRERLKDDYGEPLTLPSRPKYV